jgi:hypothetical protein
MSRQLTLSNEEKFELLLGALAGEKMASRLHPLDLDTEAENQRFILDYELDCAVINENEQQSNHAETFDGQIIENNDHDAASWWYLSSDPAVLFDNESSSSRPQPLDITTAVLDSDGAPLICDMEYRHKQIRFSNSSFSSEIKSATGTTASSQI